MNQAVHTLLKRVTFINKTGLPLEYGSGTLFSLRVTIKQLAEILARVKDARMSGTVSTYIGGTGTMVLAFSEDDMPAEYYSGSVSDVIVERSYATTDAPPVNQTLEQPIWTYAHKTPTRGAGSILPVTLTHGLVTGFTHYAESFVLPLSTYHPYGYTEATPETIYPAAAEMAFSGQVAFVDNALNGSLTDPANELWMGVEFYCWTDDNGLLDAYATSSYDIYSMDVLCGTLTLVLAEGDTVTCDLYGRATTTAAVTITATEWWPYATSANPFGRVWESETGVKIPAGAGFLDAGDPDEALAIHVFF